MKLDVEAERFPDRHQLHKYWGKKPANVVAHLIETFTRRGERVLDPFAGSGVTIVEAARLGRRAIGVELNPIAARIGRLLLGPPDAKKVAEIGEDLVAALRTRSRALYRGRCSCGADVEMRSYVWEGTKLVRVRGEHCQKIDREPDALDLRGAKKKHEIGAHPDSALPNAWEMRKLVRAGVTHMSELFTDRNRVLLAELLARIRAVEDGRVREALLLTFTANLAQCSRMIADYRGKAGGPSWKINCYWLPKRSQELNVLDYFENRLAKTQRSLADTTPSQLGEIITGDSRSLPIADGSIDYIFTDPPYGGEGVQYAELSYLWNLWLGEPTDFAREIAFNPHRKKSLADFARDLELVFRECRRVLAKKGSMTIAFNNRDPRVWELLLEATRAAGFALETQSEVARSSPALTETVAPRAPKSDVLLHFSRRSPTKSSRPAARARYRRGSSSPSDPSATR